MMSKVLAITKFENSSNGEPPILIHPISGNADEDYCSWVRSINRHGWRLKYNEFILTETCDVWHLLEVHTIIMDQDKSFIREVQDNMIKGELNE